MAVLDHFHRTLGFELPRPRPGHWYDSYHFAQATPRPRTRRRRTRTALPGHGQDTYHFASTLALARKLALDRVWHGAYPFKPA